MGPFRFRGPLQKILCIQPCTLRKHRHTEFLRSPPGRKTAPGEDVIVVDHHAFGEDVPEVTILHPDHPDGEYPFKSLAGVGITYKLVQALGLDRRT